MIRMTRRVMFSAAHTDWLENRSPAENMAIFGPSSSAEPYGHNYVLDVTVSGDLDALTGIVVNIKEIDQIVRLHVLLRVDHKLLNGPAGPLANRPVSGELLLGLIRDSLIGNLPRAASLSALRLEKTTLDVLEWRSSEYEEITNRMRSNGTVLATQIYEFSASHRLQSDSLSQQENEDLFGKCNYPNGHGHNYVLEVTVQGPVDPITGRIISPAALDEVVNREIVDRYDHRHLNLDIPEFQGTIPSSEIITMKMWDRLVELIPPPARLYRLLLRETARNFFEYCGEERFVERTDLE